MLNSKIAQRIVEATMSALGMKVNINIMDVDGIVIAAGNRDRIGSFHSAAERVIKTGEKRSVSQQEADKMDNVKPGITLPIIYKDTIIGAIGMTGDPTLVEPYGELVALTAALIVEQEEHQNKLFIEQRTRDNVMMDLITNRAFDNENIFIQRARNVDFDLSVRRLVMAACVINSNDTEKNRDLQILKNSLNSNLHSENLEISGCFINDTLAIMYPLDSDVCTQEHQLKIAEMIYSKLKKMIHSELLVCIDEPVEDWHMIPASFKTSRETLRIARQFGVNDGAFFSSKYRFQYLISKIPKNDAKTYYISILEPLFTYKSGHPDLLIKTLRTYLKNERNVQNTSAELFIHRNTLNMRLSRIAELTGYTPYNFSDACILKTALELYTIETTL